MRSARKPRVAGVPPGLAGGTTPAVIAAGPPLWLVVSQVPLDRYGPEQLEKGLRDLDWVAAVAVAHEAVVEHFARLRHAAVVPMKLFTMFSADARAVEEMESRRKEIQDVVKRIAGCEEWGVRVARDAHPVADAAPADRSGTAFLAARKRSRDAARAASGKAAVAAAAVFDGLLPFAKDVRRREESPAGAVAPLLDAAFLVPAAKRAKFQVAARRAAKACGEAGARMTLTGPWPAYNFVHPPVERS